jgi:hypothetical protein
VPGRSQLSAERLALLQQCMAEGWPLIQIYLTHRITRTTVQRHFPEYRGIPLQEAAALGAAARRLALRNQSHA